ncbi:peptidoglycan-binding domain-containing protein [Micromonospora sp. WMMC273]|uniref:peptidoglycan-binding domain-containing protein n=1 Tax=Micromonospora sp. WMMC273 TaxID=3015157 RepID=UPI0022B6D31F|nr:peptidoglycan-binding domain-containing protein [Micromonospora sp. WMMC273]MCZ7478930.1 peptidoglycan-binding domain-containing protein [Micromonospora sp. WMMC273]MCZ7478991.1 peptidoglycan-binding domain-containing protein [Micromonospora sp. WMMC273]
MSTCACHISPAFARERERLKALGGTLFGICPDADHKYGFHLPSCRLGDSDYSLRYGRGNRLYGAAIDVGMDFDGSRDWLLWLIAEARAGRKPGLVEVIGQPKGQPVLYWAKWNGWKAKVYTGSGHDRWTHLGVDRSVLAKTADLKLLAWTPGSVSKPTPAKPATPAPGPVLPFPLPATWYFGPASGPRQSVSGLHKRTFAGHTDRYWLQQFGTQLSRRGWAVGKGRTYLRSGNDGIYGPQYAALIRAFQKDQKLQVDGRLGAVTWKAAFKNPIR